MLVPIVEPVKLLKSLFARAVEVADPIRSLAEHLPPRPQGRVLVVGAGKASARMAEAVEAAWGPCEGLVITRYGYGRPCQQIEIVEAAHPVPDSAGVAATARILALLESLGEEDFVLALISGGASALLVAPSGNISLAQKQQLNQALLASGAPIDQMNTLRKHLSCVKGGQLAAAAYPATLLSLMISDVPGDNPAYIGSGPTVGDDSTPMDARQILKRWSIEVPDSVQQALSQSSRVIATADVRLSKTRNHIYAAPSQSLKAAAALAGEQGLEVRILGDALEGEARVIAAQHGQQVLSILRHRAKDARPLLLLSGGELTVTRRGEGIGGPNAEYSLALALELAGAQGVYALACDTDGVDGAAEVAGAVIGPDTLERARQAGWDGPAALDNNDAHSFFAAIDSQVVTGPTLTNVNDFRALLIMPAG